MTTFINNFKTYIETMKYKQNFIALRSGIKEQTVSRLITGKQPIKEEEMLKLAQAVNKDITFFLVDDFKVVKPEFEVSPVACYMGNASSDKEKLIVNLTEFVECADSILGKAFRVKLYEEI